MLKVEIVKACAGYIDEIMVIEELSFTIPWSRNSIMEEITVNQFANYICASVDGRITGYAGLWHVCDEGHITNIAVHPEFRGKGIGSALVKELLKFAVQAQITSMTLEVRRSNVVAQALYRKFGFEEAGYRKAYYADNGEDALIMWKHHIHPEDCSGE